MHNGQLIEKMETCVNKGLKRQLSTVNWPCPKDMVRRALLITALFLFHCSMLPAQQRKADSLRALLKARKDDTAKVSILISYAAALEELSDLKKGDSVASLALRISRNLNYKRGVATATFKMAVFHDEEGSYSKASAEYAEALKIYKEMNDKSSIASVLCNTGILYWEQGDYPDALEYYLNGLKMNEEIGDKPGIAQNTANIGLLYMSQADFTNALEYYFKALQMDEDLKLTVPLANIMSNIGGAYEGQRDHTKAINYYLKANKEYEELGSKSGMASTLVGIGDAYARMGQYDDALENFLKGLKIEQGTGSKIEIANALCSIGEAYFMKKDDANGEKYLLQSRAMADTLHHTRLSEECNGVLVNIYSRQGKWKEALDAMKLESINTDSLTNSDKSKRIGKLEAKSDYDKQLTLQQAEDEKKAAMVEAESRRQKTMIGLIAALALAIGIAALLIFRSLNATRKQKTLIEEQKLAVEQQKHIVDEKNAEVLESLNYAKHLQDAILPPLSIIKKYLPESFVLYKPKDIVAGDFYWMEKAGEVVLIAACDCTGHGVPGAMVSVVCSNALNRTVKEFHITEPGKILDKVRELVLETFSHRDPLGERGESDVQDGMDMSLCCINTQTLEMQWSGANNPLWYIRNGELMEVAPDKQPIGKFHLAKPFSTQSVKLQKGDSLYLFTDGYADQFGGPNGKKFKYKRLIEKLKAISSKLMDEQKSLLDEEFESWKGGLEQIDDVLVMGIRV